jgi:hypothetical protein
VSRDGIGLGLVTALGEGDMEMVAALDSNQRPVACQALPPERCATSVGGRAK